MMRSRRRFLVGMVQHPLALKLGTVLGILASRRAVAIARSPSDPEPDRFREAMRLELRGTPVVDSLDITLDVPPVAEDGAIVPVLIESRMPATDRLVLFVEKNPFPMIAAFQFADRARSFASLRIKMNESSAVVALARANGTYYRSTQRVRVVRGGCG